ncbi:MAG: 16S rRNA (cytosine(1402)-N(4))-methyltransferase RsmH [Devosiaceae bacterium]|nr:16S rRNA (cytosine(1402)-N(4))-methyltransferase RsmH [Devosiaceae bacterium MH13]
MTETEASHVPVLLPEVLNALGPIDDQLVVDGTFGAGGYTKAFLEAGARVIGLDRDPTAIAAGEALVAQSAGSLVLKQVPFSQMLSALEDAGEETADAVVLDIGVSSMQLDQAERGFSFRHDGPLDMRMGEGALSAADIVNDWPEAALAELIYRYGEERRSRAIARLICEVRQEWRIETTRALANLIEKLLPHRRGKGGGPVIHPATRTFQALRIAVNDELGELVRALLAAQHVLAPGGRLVVVTFHSLEDRIVKRFMGPASAGAGGSRHLPQVDVTPAAFAPNTKRPVVPGDAELSANPRSRSAKLRAAVRTDAPAQGWPQSPSAWQDFMVSLGAPVLRQAPLDMFVAGPSAPEAKDGGQHAVG